MAQVTASAVHGSSKPRWELTVVRPDPAAADVSFGELGEADLVAACLGGQTGAFDVIVERHRRTVYQLCYRFVGNHEDASDLSQDVFLRAYRGLKHFRGQSSIATWLYRIGVNVRLNRVSVKVPPNEPIEARQHIDRRSESPDDRVLRDARAGRIRAAVAQRPRSDRAQNDLDDVLDVRQQARFRVFEGEIERRKVELVVRARQDRRQAREP